MKIDLKYVVKIFQRWRCQSGQPIKDFYNSTCILEILETNKTEFFCTKSNAYRD
jgi:hypothetical protein